LLVLLCIHFPQGSFMAVLDAGIADGRLLQQLRLNEDPANIVVSAEAAKHNFVLLVKELEILRTRLHKLEEPCQPVQLPRPKDIDKEQSKACIEDSRIAKLEAELRKFDFRLESHLAHFETLALDARARSVSPRTEPRSTPTPRPGVRSGSTRLHNSQEEAIGDRCAHWEHRFRSVSSANPLKKAVSCKQLRESSEDQRRLRSASPQKDPMLQRHSSRPESPSNTSTPPWAGVHHRRATVPQKTSLAAGAQGHIAGVQSRSSLKRAEVSQAQAALHSNNSRLTIRALNGTSR